MGKSPRRGFDLIPTNLVQIELDSLIRRNPNAVSDRMKYKVSIADLKRPKREKHRTTLKRYRSESPRSIAASMFAFRPSLCINLIDNSLNNNLSEKSVSKSSKFKEECLTICSRLCLLLICHIPLLLALIYTCLIGNLIRLYKLLFNSKRSQSISEKPTIFKY